MSRVVRLIAVCLASLAVAAAAVVAVGGAPSVKAGRLLYGHRVVLRQLARAAAGTRPAVAWLGDSSMMPTPTFTSYPSRIDVGRLRPLGMRGVEFAAMGFDFYAYHSLVDDVLDLGPRVVVLVANFRVSIPQGGVRGFNDLTAELPLGRLPPMLALPYNFRGMTAPRLLLARMLRPPWGEEAFYIVEGSRSLFHEQPFWDRVGPVAPRALTPWEVFNRGRDQVLADYRYRLNPGHPLIRFAAATVARAVARGARVIVVITPAPITKLTPFGWYDADDFRQRTIVLRDAVEGAGGVLLDLHEALPDALFRDPGGHFTDEGTTQVAELIWPTLARELDAGRPDQQVAR